MTTTSSNDTPSDSPSPAKGPSDAEIRATVDAFLYDVDAAFAAELTQSSERLRTTLKKAENALAEAAASLAKSRQKLQALVEETQDGPAPDAGALARLAGEIDGQLAWIFRKVRPGVDRELRSLAPRRKPILSLLQRASRAYAGAAAALPDEIPPPTPGEDAPTAPPALTGRVKRSGRELASRLRFQVESSLHLSTRNVIEEFLASRPDPRDHPLVSRYEELFDQATTRITDIWRGVRFHLEVAADELKKSAAAPEEEPQEETAAVAAATAAAEAAEAVESTSQALEVLSEAEGTLPTALTPLAAFIEALPDELARGHQAFVQDLRQEFERAETWDRTLRHLGRRLFRTLGGWRDKGQEVLEQGREEMVRSASSGLTQGENLLRNIQSLLGKGGQQEEVLLKLTDLPTRPQVLDRAGELPLLYQRLFTLGPLKNQEFLVAREEELEELEDIFRRWQAGKICSVALIGPEGSGKTSLVNCFEHLHASKGDFLRTDLRQRLQSEGDVLRFFQKWLQIESELTSPDELVAHLLGGPRRVLLIEGGHHLGLRVIGGYRGARTFLHVMMATRRHCLWFVTFRKYPWNRLDYQLGIAQYFTHRVRTLFHDQDQVREAILLRHRTSGLPLLFGNGTGSGGSSEEEQAAAENRFFQDLFKASSGSVDAAIYFWLISIRYDEQVKAIQVASLGEPGYEFIRALGRDYLFALAEVVSHGGLTLEEYGSIFRRDPLEGRMLLEYLTHLNILSSDGDSLANGPPRYGLNPIFFGPVTQVLESLNILY